MAKNSLNASELVGPAIGVGVLVLGYQVGKKLGVFGDTGAPDAPDEPEGSHDIEGEPTLTRQAAQNIAARIYAAIYGDGTLWSGNAGEDEAAVVAAMTEAQNDADVQLILHEYGERTGGFALTGPLTLPAAIQEYLEPRHIAQINADYEGKGIQFRF